MFSKSAGVALALLTALVLPAQAAIVLDQNQPFTDGLYAYLTPAASSDQFFQQSANNIAGAGFYLTNGSLPTTVTISFFDAGNLLASGSALLTASGWLDVFWAPVAVPNSSLLYLSVQGVGDLTYATNYAANNPYADGVASYTFTGILNPAYDLTFRTFADTDFNSAVPEPSTWAMMILGFAGIGFMAYRRRKPATLAA